MQPITTHTPAVLTPSRDAPIGPFTIVRALGALRTAAAAYLETHHYMRSSGGSGQMFAVVDQRECISGAVLIGATASQNCDRAIAGACLIGPTASADAERSIASSDVCIRQIKRSHLQDDLPLYESHLLRVAMHQVCNDYGHPVLFVSYADPAATDERTGVPLLGWTYLAAGFFYAGETTSRRACVIDHRGRARSTRQGRVTLSRATLPKAGEVFHGEQITQD